jgi:hypothetical protein
MMKIIVKFTSLEAAIYWIDKLQEEFGFRWTSSKGLASPDNIRDYLGKQGCYHEMEGYDCLYLDLKKRYFLFATNGRFHFLQMEMGL